MDGESIWPVPSSSGKAITAVPLYSTPDTVHQGTWTPVFESTEFPPYELDNGNPGAQNDGFTYNMWLGAGTYTVEYRGFVGTGSGILTIQIDGVTLTTIDMYAAVGAVATQKTSTGCVIASSGLKAVKIYMPTKNAASTGYRARISQILFRPTA